MARRRKSGMPKHLMPIIGAKLTDGKKDTAKKPKSRKKIQTAKQNRLQKARTKILKSIIHDILEVSPDFSQAGNVTSYGWSAVLFAVISIIVYIAALMCSHMSAFRVAANIRKELMRHITALPLGVTEKYGSAVIDMWY